MKCINYDLFKYSMSSTLIYKVSKFNLKIVWLN